MTSRPAQPDDKQVGQTIVSVIAAHL